ncbi:FISUMP domain-containing protein [Sunxiuqinia sp. A32]|uniref:FISUMP domain-containing protein n=1 Tax=Sunxiuqinia sp. A32 TaxID=3461496 RepID=UPI004045608F
MKKLSALFVLVFLTISYLHAQDIILTFNAKDASSTIDSIKAFKVESGETAFVEGSNTINMSSFTTGTKLFPSNPEEICVYPNPFENYTQLILRSSQNDNIKVSLINAAGQIVAEKKQNVTLGIHQFNISTNDNGLYILNITGNQTKFSQKIISTRNNQYPNKIEYSGYSSISQHEKSAKTAADELLNFFVYSGDNITKIADSPTESKTYEVEFHECKDAAGKSYPIIQIGDQWWMAENLAYLPKVDSLDYESWNVPAYSVYGYNGTNSDEARETANYKTYGVLYNWFAALQSCPKGWHLPSDFDWNQLAEFINSENGGSPKTEAGWENIGNLLKTTSSWENEGNGTDDYGFSALPSGITPSYYYDGSSVGKITIFWSSNGGIHNGHSNFMAMFFDSGNLMDFEGAESNSRISARYIKGVSEPIAYTNFTSEVTETTATLNAFVLSDNGSEITQKGFYYTEAGTELINDENKIIIEGSDYDFSYDLNNLTSGKNYQFCAFAINSEGSSLGDTITFRTSTNNIEYGTFVDSRDNHEYKTIQIGNETWMAENLAFDAGDGCWAYDDNESNVNIYGRLYNWETAKNACPEGWHIPTNEEWQSLALHAGSSLNISRKNFMFWTEGYMSIGRNLKSKNYWFENGSMPGPGTDNFGFGAFPGGMYFDGMFDALHYSGRYWSLDKDAYTWGFSSGDYLEPGYNSVNPAHGYSVRCVKDNLNLGVIELNDQECPNAGLVMAQFTDDIGLVKTSPSTGLNYIDYYEEYSDGGSIAIKLYPCNISNEQLIAGAEIKFSGIVYTKDNPDDNTIDSDFAQIVISSAEYVK